MARDAGSPRLTALPAGQNPDGFKVSLRDLPARTVAYIRVFDPYRDGAVQAASERLVAWVGRPFAQGRDHFELALQLPVTRA
jgi:AraC family transcriptional regulator